MDPNACYEAWLEARINGDRVDCRDRWDDLTAWLSRGGFPPSNWSKFQRRQFELSEGELP
jgi:hypothetical protein